MARSKRPTRRRSNVPPPDEPAAVRATVSRIEWWAIAAVTLLGFAIRIGFPGRMAVEHFDEGVYVANLWFPDGGYPFRHLYAPPLVPAVLEWSMVFLGPGRWGTLVPGILCGTLTVPLLWWVGREWFGRAAGLAAAMLIATSDFHALYSRSAMVDVFLAFWLTAAVYCGWRALRRTSTAWAVAAGVTTGLAWACKYNGWLAVAIVVSGSVPWWVLQRNERPSPLRIVGVWLVMAVTAIVVWSPVWWGLQSVGGYASVAENHAQYFGGLSNWGTAFATQFGHQRLLCGLPTLLGPGLAILLVLALRRAGGISPLFGSPDETNAASQTDGAAKTDVASQTSVRQGTPGEQPADAGRSPRELAMWLNAAWFLGLCAAIPMYRAYPRLVVPWTVAACLGLGGAIDWWLRTRFAERFGFVVAGVLIVGAIGFGSLVGITPEPFSDRLGATVPAWQDRTDRQRVAQLIAKGAGPSSIVFVYAEPPLVHHLSRLGVAAFPAGGLDLSSARRSGTEVLLVSGPHAARSPAFAEEWKRHGDAFELVAEYKSRPSVLVLLNHHTAGELRREPAITTPPFRVHRLK